MVQRTAPIAASAGLRSCRVRSGLCRKSAGGAASVFETDFEPRYSTITFAARPLRPYRSPGKNSCIRKASSPASSR
jgi:hypothetical protein